MVMFVSGMDARAKAEASERMSRFRSRTRSTLLQDARYEVFRDWHHCAIRERVALPSFPPAPATTARGTPAGLGRIRSRSRRRPLPTAKHRRQLRCSGGGLHQLGLERPRLGSGLVGRPAGGKSTRHRSLVEDQHPGQFPLSGGALADDLGQRRRFPKRRIQVSDQGGVKVWKTPAGFSATCAGARAGAGRGGRIDVPGLGTGLYVLRTASGSLLQQRFL